MVKLLRSFLTINDFREDASNMADLIQNQKKLEKEINTLLSESNELRLQLSARTTKLAQNEKELSETRLKLQMLSGDLNVLTNLSLEELNDLEIQIFRC